MTEDDVEIVREFTRRIRRRLHVRFHSIIGDHSEKAILTCEELDYVIDSELHQLSRASSSDRGRDPRDPRDNSRAFNPD